ncbi:MAG: UvrD-helicase domain-containing protein [Anaerolineae bacterium]|nr:UvrD-helicase domain-containing protein [Anaerolineae bacterium]
MHLLKLQRQVAEEHFNSTLFLEGVSGTGKTTAGIERVKNLLREGVAPESILVLAPQAALTTPYRDAIRRSRVVKGAGIQTATMSSLAVRTVDLFWPLIAEEVGFANPLDRPHFLSLELVQYYMTRFVEPEIRRKDYFNSVHISQNRLYTQIVDNLNKAALVGFPHDTLAERLKSAWAGESEQAYIYDDAQACANLFREMCRQHNLLDFSLQMILFTNYLWQMPQPRRYLTDQYRHLIVDNLEEDNPATHDILTDWLKECDSALLIYDSEAGYRRFLGADPQNALKLKAQCKVHITLDKPRVMSPELEAFQIEMARSLKQSAYNEPAQADARDAIAYADNRYLLEMVDWTVEQIADLIHNQGVSPKEIVILSAFLPDALRFSLQTRLSEHSIASRSHRPSRALREEPASRTLITLAKLAHPGWQNLPGKFDAAFALTSAISDLDLVRSRLLTDVLFRKGELLPFDKIQDTKVQTRITFELGKRYEKLRKWLDVYREGEPLPLDVFFSRLFGEVLSQPHFGFHRNFDAANATANLIDSAREFRQTVSKIEPDLPIASEYIRMVDSGVIANQYVRDPLKGEKDAVLIAPAYAFLMDNTPVDYQFWLNIGSTGWGQRLYQPLTHPYVLSREWTEERKWTDDDEFRTNQEAVYLLLSGLIRRCRQRVYLGFSQYGEQGFEQRGTVLMAVQSMLRRLTKEEGNV